MKKPNQMDSRNRSGFDIVADLRKLAKPSVLAVLGTHNVDAGELADALRSQWPQIVEMVGFEPSRLLTGCADVGAEKAARLVAKDVTGKLAVVFHRAEMTYGRKKAEEMRDVLVAQEGHALLVLRAGKKVCTFVRERFSAYPKKVYEIEVG